MSHTKIYFRIWIGLTLLFVVVFGYFIFIIRARGQQASQLINEADSATDQQGLAESIQTIKNSSKDDIAALEKYALSEDSLVPFIEFLETSGKSMGLTTHIASVNLTKPDARSATLIDQARIEIETDGAWNASIGFVHLLENLPTSVIITSSSMSAGNASEVTSGQTTPSNTQSNPKRVWHTKTVLLVNSFK